MSLIIDIIKIKYSVEGYLPNYPPHLISDEEMCDAFLYNDIAYFYDTYPLLSDDLLVEYQSLVAALDYHIKVFLDRDSKDWEDLPDWVYSYMIGSTVHETSTHQDKHYLLVGLNVDNIEDTLTGESQIACYKLSKQWVEKISTAYKKPIKFEYEEIDGLTSIPVSVIEAMYDNTWDGHYTEGAELITPIPEDIILEITSNQDYEETEGPDLPEHAVVIDYDRLIDIIEGEVDEEDLRGHIVIGVTTIRPPTMFGEPHVIKQLRLMEATGALYIL